MGSGKWLVVLGIGALVAGCDGKEKAALQERQKQLLAELAEKQAIAQNLGQFKQELAAIEAKVSEAKAKLHRPDTAELKTVFAALKLKEALVQDDAGAPHARLSGEGGGTTLVASLHALDASASTVALRQLTVDGKKWSAELEVPAEPKPAAAAAEKIEPMKRPAPGPLPEQSFLASSETKTLRTRITQTEKAIADLGKVIAEVKQLSEKKAAAKAELDALETIKPQERLAGTLPMVEKLFGGAKPVLAKATAQVEGTHLKLTDLPKKPDLKKLGQAGKIVQSGPGTAELEPL